MSMPRSSIRSVRFCSGPWSTTGKSRRVAACDIITVRFGPAISEGRARHWARTSKNWRSLSRGRNGETSPSRCGGTRSWGHRTGPLIRLRASVGSQVGRRRAGQHPIHQRHHGAPERRDLTHHNLLNNGLQVGVVTGIGPEDRGCLPVPLYPKSGYIICRSVSDRMAPGTRRGREAQTECRAIWRRNAAKTVEQ